MGAVDGLEDREDIGLAADIALDRESITAGSLDVADQASAAALLEA